MKLHDAFHKMNSGDKFKSAAAWQKIYKDRANVLRWEDSDAPLEYSNKNMNREGEIIRAEPEVLTAKEILSKIDVKCSFFSDTSWVHVVDAIDISDKNGRNKEWKRIQDQLKKGILLQEITPPWEPEK